MLSNNENNNMDTEILNYLKKNRYNDHYLYVDGKNNSKILTELKISAYEFQQALERLVNSGKLRKEKLGSIGFTRTLSNGKIIYYYR